jgi:transcriptional regulator with XRE-family HTH domain
MHDDVDTVDVARAGAAFAARREELGLSQRELAQMKIISAPALIAFEKGRTWPRDRTRAKLEQAAQWPPGALAKLSAGGTPEASTAKETARDESSSLVTGAVSMAAGQVLASADRLPAVTDPAFPGQVRTVLVDLRTLETITARAVRSSQGSAEVIKLLATIRHRYGALMAQAAAAPGATVGQRLFAARTAAALSVAETAGALGVTPDVVTAAESDQPVSEQIRGRIESLVADLAG